MNRDQADNPHLKVWYDEELDILNALIPGRKIATSSEITSPLIIDFGSEEDGFDVVGFELHSASKYLGPMLSCLHLTPTSQD